MLIWINKFEKIVTLLTFLSQFFYNVFWTTLDFLFWRNKCSPLNRFCPRCYITRVVNCEINLRLFMKPSMMKDFWGYSVNRFYEGILAFPGFNKFIHPSLSYSFNHFCRYLRVIMMCMLIFFIDLKNRSFFYKPLCFY